ncbi:hypothetical protein [Tunturiibacter gelidoferens]|uniref:Uncharacterized protein n=1 Tax=Tunturiibacter gelidiferens TaxID=3069689 RepID=A0ACC5NT69_9BACT|nr:hypothetical protein [Edaphobacter lichenicola]MBB5337737.1 hypothetical protein [Edaphobacter lichenicola]
MNDPVKYRVKYLRWFALDWCYGAGVAQLRVEMWVGETGNNGDHQG